MTDISLACRTLRRGRLPCRPGVQPGLVGVLGEFRGLRPGHRDRGSAVAPDPARRARYAGQHLRRRGHGGARDDRDAGFLDAQPGDRALRRVSSHAWPADRPRRGRQDRIAARLFRPRPRHRGAGSVLPRGAAVRDPGRDLVPGLVRGDPGLRGRAARRVSQHGTERGADQRPLLELIRAAARDPDPGHHHRLHRQRGRARPSSARPGPRRCRRASTPRSGRSSAWSGARSGLPSMPS